MHVSIEYENDSNSFIYNIYFNTNKCTIIYIYKQKHALYII